MSTETSLLVAAKNSNHNEGKAMSNQTRTMTKTETEETPAPCQCHTTFAYISPMHPGHCCFQPATQTCHPAEVAAWEAEAPFRRGEKARS